MNDVIWASGQKVRLNISNCPEWETSNWKDGDILTVVKDYGPYQPDMANCESCPPYGYVKVTNDRLPESNYWGPYRMVERKYMIPV